MVVPLAPPPKPKVNPTILGRPPGLFRWKVRELRAERRRHVEAGLVRGQHQVTLHPEQKFKAFT